MSLLICKFASRESKPEKIQRWIEYLEEVKQRAQVRERDVALVDRLRSEAQTWLARG